MLYFNWKQKNHLSYMFRLSKAFREGSINLKGFLAVPRAQTKKQFQRITFEDESLCIHYSAMLYMRSQKTRGRVCE